MGVFPINMLIAASLLVGECALRTLKPFSRGLLLSGAIAQLPMSVLSVAMTIGSPANLRSAASGDSMHFVILLLLPQVVWIAHSIWSIRLMRSRKLKSALEFPVPAAYLG